MPKTDRPDDPLADYNEWVRHRYDPGHYLGGTIAPHLRKARLGPRARRRSAVLLALLALLSIQAVITPPEPAWLARPLGVAFTALLCLAAGRMWRIRA
jgi:hypothetical protein